MTMTTLTPGAAAMNRGLIAATAVLYRLDQAGINVRSVEVRGGKPVVSIDPPPVGSLIKGAMRRRDKFRMVIAAPFFGAQLEWDAVRVRQLESA